MAAWRVRDLTAGTKSIEVVISRLRAEANRLEQMHQDGVVLEAAGLDADDARLVTTDPDLAQKYGLVDESEYWAADDSNEEETPVAEPGDSHPRE